MCSELDVRQYIWTLMPKTQDFLIQTAKYPDAITFSMESTRKFYWKTFPILHTFWHDPWGGKNTKFVIAAQFQCTSTLFFRFFFLLTKRLLSHIQSVGGLVAENNREQLCSFWCLENNSNFWHLDMQIWDPSVPNNYAVIRIIWLLLNGETFFMM